MEDSFVISFDCFFLLFRFMMGTNRNAFSFACWVLAQISQISQERLTPSTWGNNKIYTPMQENQSFYGDAREK